MNRENVKFGLRKIETLEYATFKDVTVDEAQITLNYGFGFGINQTNHILGCAVHFTFMSDKQPFIKLEVKCDFEIETGTWEHLIQKADNEIVFPREIILHLATLTVGTARGVLHTKTENAPFNKYFVPTINITEHLKDDVRIALSDSVMQNI